MLKAFIMLFWKDRFAALDADDFIDFPAVFCHDGVERTAWCDLSVNNDEIVILITFVIW